MDTLRADAPNLLIQELWQQVMEEKVSEEKISIIKNLVTRVSTQGIVTINMMIILKDIKKLGYDVQAYTTGNFISEFPVPNFKDNQKTIISNTCQPVTEISQNEENDDEIQVKNFGYQFI